MTTRKMITRIEKPWGFEELLTVNNNYAMKKLVIREGQRISLQYHNKKHETWYVVSGNGSATIGSELRSLKTGDVIVISPKVIHRAFSGKGDLVIIEASTPELDDVERIADDYNRC